MAYSYVVYVYLAVPHGSCPVYTSAECLMFYHIHVVRSMYIYPNQMTLAVPNDETA